MEFGYHLGLRGHAARPESLVTIATAAERLGFRHLGFSDHVVIASDVNSRYPYTSTGRWFAEDSGECLEQVTTMAFVAAATRWIRLLTSVMVLPHRPPLLAAKMLTTVDVLSAGRLTVGLGVGWMAEEIALLGGPEFSRRGQAADEYIEAFRSLWTDPAPAFDGAHVRFRNLKFTPRPVQAPHPPIWIGGESRASRRRAGRLGDAWYPVGNNPAAPLETPAAYGDAVNDVIRAAETCGRDPSTIAQALFAIWYRPGEPEAGLDGQRRRFTGPAGAILEDVDAFQRAGLQHLIIGGESDSVAHCVERMHDFAESIMRPLTG